MSFSTKQDRVAEIIRERIIVGIYDRGTKLKQADIAEELGVSITPVREALLMLEAEGYVRGLPHKGLLVPELVFERLGEIFHLRLMLERDLTEAALKNILPPGLRKLRELQRSLQAAIETGDLYEVRTANYRFHFSLYEMADRPQTLHFVRVLWAQYPFTAQDVKQDRPSRMRSEHERFLQMLEAGDHAGAVAAMVGHIRNGWREITREAERADAPAEARKAVQEAAPLPP